MGSWAEVKCTASFLEPCEVVGTVEEIAPLATSDGETRQLLVRTRNGGLITVNAVQEQLRFKLLMADVEVGDRVRIRYLGEADKALPGMAPTKRFTVEVRKESQPPAGTEVQEPGEVKASENAPGAGQ